MSRVAFIGLGIMGQPMARRLLTAGHSLTVHTRTRSRADALVADGAIRAATPADAACEAEIIFICVPDTPDVEAVIFGDRGVAHGAGQGTIVVDHSTISPSATRIFAQKLAARGNRFLDAPVSGGDVGAKNATLSIMCGGEPDAFSESLPLLQLMGKTITHCGPAGAGQLTKLVNQILVLGTLLAVSEAMSFAQANGLNPETTLQAVGAGAGRSWQLEQLGPKMARGDFSPGFLVDLAQKDLRLVLEAAEQTRLPLRGAALVHDLYNQVQSMGFGRDGTQALYRAIEQAHGR